jgi:exosortase/archaeosortase family protein
MLTAFIVVAAVLAYIVNRPKWQKVTLLLSAVPIAIICNLARLMATAILFMIGSSATAETFFHDFAGVSMMPLAVLLLIAELWLLDRLVIADNSKEGPTASC